MSYKKVSKEKLKDAINASAPKLPEDTVFIAGARAIKDGQIEVEFVQCRALAGRKASLRSLLNEGDSRFSTGKTTMRVWTMVSILGFMNRFKDAEIDFKAVAELCQSLEKEQRVAILQAVKTIDIDGVKHPVKIVCRETTIVDELPKSIREQILDDEIEDSIKERYILQTGGANSQRIVDEFGNTVYRHFDLAYGDDTDVLVANKMLLSEYKDKKGRKNTTQNVLSDMASQLTD